MFEEIWNYGFPQEMRPFRSTACSADAEPMETGADGRAVLEIIYAMYMAAGGAGRVSLPLEISPEVAARPPYLCWKEPAAGRVVGSD